MLSDAQLREGISILRRIESEIMELHGPTDARSEGACNSAHMWEAALNSRLEVRRLGAEMERTLINGNFHAALAAQIKNEKRIIKLIGEAKYCESWVADCYPELFNRVMSEINK